MCPERSETRVQRGAERSGASLFSGALYIFDK